MKNIEKSRIVQLMDQIVSDPRHHIECVQIAITGQDQCGILFEISDSDHELSISVIFLVESFDKAFAKPIFILDEWLLSLSATHISDLSALEVGRDVWRNVDGGWNRSVAADWFNNRIWCFRPGESYLVGEKGLSSRFDGTNYTPIAPSRKTLLFDIHGVQESGIFCVGSGGTLQRLKEASWEPIEIPISCRLRAIDATRVDRLLFGGDDGNCFELRDFSELVTLEVPNNTFFSVREFKGSVYWGDAVFGVYVQNGTTFDEFYETSMAFDMRCDDEFLYCSGIDTAWRFDGRNWKSLKLVYADGVFTLE